MALKFLMSRCQYCGAVAKGKYYTLLLILTPFALIFYTLIIAAFLYAGITTPEFNNPVGYIAVFICIMAFLVPGLLVLLLLKRPMGTCDPCMHRINVEMMGPSRRPPYEVAPARSIAEKEPRPQPQQTDMDAIVKLLDNNPSAKEVINRNSARIPVLTMPLAQQVIQATIFEWTNNIEEAAKVYESLGLRDEAGRVRSKNQINNNAVMSGKKGLS